ncbi:MAG TPA: zinc ABC transporter substrate-binding protein [bacterium]|nr:zinc ABC transporter substrate-binding protein [bacterium]
MKRVIILAVLMLAGMGCGRKPVRTGPVIATSIFPIADVTARLAGPEAEVFFVIPPGANPHSYEPVPSDVRRLQKVDLFIGVHPEFDGWIRRFLPPRVLTINLIEPEHGHAAENEDGHNPHIWLSVKRMRRLLPELTRQLCQADSQAAERIKEAGRVYADSLDRLDRSIHDLMSGVQDRPFIQWHPAWTFFARDYGLSLAGSIQRGHGHEPSLKSFEQLTSEAREKGVRLIVIGLNLESRAVEALAREIGADVLQLDNLGDPEIPERSSYIRLMRYNAERLASALRAVRTVKNTEDENE